MNNKPCFFFVSFFIVASACNHDQPNFFFKEEDFPVDTIYVNAPDENLTAEDIFAQIEFIPLETNRTSLFANIDDIIILSDRYIILDTETNAVLLFEKSGKFIGKFDAQYNGEDIKFSQIILDAKSEEILVKDTNSFHIIIFGKDGAIRRVKTEDSDYYTFTIRENGDIVFFNHYLPDKKYAGNRSSAFLLEVKDTTTMTTKHELLPYNTKAIQKDELVNNLKNFYRLGDTFHLVISGELKYYTLDEDNSIAKGRFIKLDGISHFQTPTDFLSNTKYFGKRRDFLKKKPELYHNIRAMYSNKGGTIYVVANNKSYRNIVHAHKNPPIFAEDLSYSMDFFGLPPIPLFVIGSDGECFYSFYTSKAFLETINKLPNRSSLLESNSVIREIYKQQNLLSNPILVRFKLKS